MSKNVAEEALEALGAAGGERRAREGRRPISGLQAVSSAPKSLSLSGFAGAGRSCASRDRRGVEVPPRASASPAGASSRCPGRGKAAGQRLEECRAGIRCQLRPTLLVIGDAT